MTTALCVYYLYISLGRSRSGQSPELLKVLSMTASISIFSMSFDLLRAGTTVMSKQHSLARQTEAPIFKHYPGDLLPEHIGE